MARMRQADQHKCVTQAADAPEVLEMRKVWHFVSGVTRWLSGEALHCYWMNYLGVIGVPPGESYRTRRDQMRHKLAQQLYRVAGKWQR